MSGAAFPSGLVLDFEGVEGEKVQILRLITNRRTSRLSEQRRQFAIFLRPDKILHQVWSGVFRDYVDTGDERKKPIELGVFRQHTA